MSCCYKLFFLKVIKQSWKEITFFMFPPGFLSPSGSHSQWLSSWWATEYSLGWTVPESLHISEALCEPTSSFFGIVNKAEVDVFPELSCFFDDSMYVGNLISGSSAFSETSLNIRKFAVPVLLKPVLENFEHYFTSMWNKCNCVVVWAFFGVAFLWDWSENWPFPVLWPLLSFANLLSILSAALSQCHLSGFEIAQLEFHPLH